MKVDVDAVVIFVTSAGIVAFGIAVDVVVEGVFCLLLLLALHLEVSSLCYDCCLRASDSPGWACGLRCWC